LFTATDRKAPSRPLPPTLHPDPATRHLLAVSDRLPPNHEDDADGLIPAPKRPSSHHSVGSSSLLVRIRSSSDSNHRLDDEQPMISNNPGPLRSTSEPSGYPQGGTPRRPRQKFECLHSPHGRSILAETSSSNQNTDVISGDLLPTAGPSGRLRQTSGGSLRIPDGTWTVKPIPIPVGPLYHSAATGGVAHDGRENAVFRFLRDLPTWLPRRSSLTAPDESITGEGAGEVKQRMKGGGGRPSLRDNRRCRVSDAFMGHQH